MDIIFAATTGSTVWDYLYKVFPVIGLLIPLGFIIVFFVRALLNNVAEMLGIKKEERMFLSLSLIFTKYEDFKEFTLQNLKYFFFPENDTKKAVLFATIIYLVANLGGFLPIVLETGDIRYLFYGKRFVIPWSILGKIFVVVSWIFLISLLISLALFILRTLMAFKKLIIH